MFNESKIGLLEVPKNRDDLIRNAKCCLEIANKKVLRQKKETNIYLSPWLKWDDIAFSFYESAEAFRVCGDRYWRDSADCYEKAARIQQESKCFREAAFLYCEAGNVMLKASTSCSEKYYKYNNR